MDPSLIRAQRRAQSSSRMAPDRHVDASRSRSTANHANGAHPSVSPTRASQRRPHAASASPSRHNRKAVNGVRPEDRSVTTRNRTASPQSTSVASAGYTRYSQYVSPSQSHVRHQRATNGHTSYTSNNRMDDDTVMQYDSISGVDTSANDYQGSSHMSQVSHTRHHLHNSRVYVRLLIEKCRGLIPEKLAEQHPPTTFLAIQTSTCKGKSVVVQNNANPVFNQEFFLPVADPENDSVTITCIVITPAGKRKLSECVLSFQNLERDVKRHYRAAMVHRAGRYNARERGHIYLSMETRDFDTATKNRLYYDVDRFRSKVRSFLLNNACEELHRLEWLVGQYCILPNGLKQLEEKYHSPPDERLSVVVTVREVSGLTGSSDATTHYETCYVKIATDTVRVQTKMVPYHRTGSIDQSFALTFAHPDRDFIELSVYSGDHFYGECVVSAIGLLRGVDRHVTCMLIRDADTQQATPCGEVTLTLRAKSSPANLQSLSISKAKEWEETLPAVRKRIANYLWRYLPSELHKVSVIAESNRNINAYMRSLVERHGPEPGKHKLDIRLLTGESLCNVGADPSRLAILRDDSSRARKLHVVIRTGITRIVSRPVSGTDTWVFNETLSLPVSYPDEEEVLIIIEEERLRNDVEISRAVLSLRNLVCNTSTTKSINMVHNAQTKNAHVEGTMGIELFTNDFGLPEPLISEDREKYMRTRLEALLSRYNPEQLHCVEFMLGDSVGHENELLQSLVTEYGPEVGTAPMTIHIIGIRKFIPACSCYVKAYYNNEAVLCTRDHYGAVDVNFDIADNNEVTVMLSNPQRATLRFKVAQHSMFKSKVFAYVDVNIRNMVRDAPNDVWVPFFGPDNEPMGELGVQLTSTGFIRFPQKRYQAVNADGMTLMEEVVSDVTSFIRKFKPEKLGQVQPLIALASSPEYAHAELRESLAPRPIAATVYIAVEEVKLQSEVSKENALRGNVSVTAAYGEETARTAPKTLWARNIINQTTYFPTMRLDLSGIDVARNVEGRYVPPGLELTVCDFFVPGAQEGSSAASAPGRPSNLPATFKPHAPTSVQRERVVGKVIVSLRALLTRALFNIGEPITLDLVDVNRLPKVGSGNVELTRDASHIISGTITFRVRLPVCEHIPYWLHFNPKKMRRVNREYIRYFEHRIAAMMRDYDPQRLLSFHQNMYERDVATDRWPISLYDWLVALIKQYGPEKSTFPPAPRLSFDPESEEIQHRMGKGPRPYYTAADENGGAVDVTDDDDKAEDGELFEEYSGYSYDEFHLANEEEEEREARPRHQQPYYRWKRVGAARKPSVEKPTSSAHTRNGSQRPRSVPRSSSRGKRRQPPVSPPRQKRVSFD